MQNFVLRAKNVSAAAKALAFTGVVLLTSCAPPGTALQHYAREGIQAPEYYKNFDDWENQEADAESPSGPHDHAEDDPAPTEKVGDGKTSTPTIRGCSAAGNKPCFPIAGPARFRNDYGASRGGGARRHAGNDIMAAKLSPVIAIDAGVIDTVRTSGGLSGAYVAINHGNGIRSVYMHLNNDSPGTNDGRGRGIVAGIRVGTRVKKGQHIGWVGNSGNAETTAPHLHFELRVSKSTRATRQSLFYPINPYRMLKEAEAFKSSLPHRHRY